MMICLLVVLLSAAGCSVLIDPGPLCTGQTVTLTCNITGTSFLAWTYGSDRFVTINTALSNPVMEVSDTITFTVSTEMSISPHFVSRISFVASERMNGMRLTCDGVNGTGAVRGSVTLQVVMNGRSKGSNVCILVSE